MHTFASLVYTFDVLKLRAHTVIIGTMPNLLRKKTPAISTFKFGCSNFLEEENKLFISYKI